MVLLDFVILNSFLLMFHKSTYVLTSLESLCLQLQMQLSKVTAENYDLKQKLKESSHRMRNISQQVRDVKSAKKKLEELVSSLRNDEYISEQAAEVLKVRCQTKVLGISVTSKFNHTLIAEIFICISDSQCQGNN